MIAVIFEVYPNAGKLDTYLDIAKMLRPELDKIEGFISIERFQSLTNPDKLLSLSFWQDEKSVIKWRNQVMHRTAQKAGRETILNDYRLRVASVIRDYGMDEREQAPEDTPF